ncbi:MAG: DUF2163 domain-containing protein [Limnohabitans sp.]
MKSYTPDLIALLNSSTQFIMADLYTITLATGTVLRYTGADVDITYGGNTYSARGPLIRRGQVRTVLGLEVDTLGITVMASATNGDHLLEGEPFIPAALKGALDGASVLLQRAFLTDWGQPPVGAVVLFSGRASDMSGKRTELNGDIKSDLELLNTKLPRNIYQASCLHTLYDAGCAANKADLTVSGSVTGNNGTGQWIQSGLSVTSGWFDQGVITFSTGPNAGQRRTVKAYASGQFWFALPLSNVPTVGDAFTVYPGCDKTQATCQSKFNNLSRFRGFPYIPIPETAT